MNIHAEKFLLHYIKLKSAGKSLGDVLKNKNINSICIYGAGVIGELLLNLEVEGDWFVVTSPLDPELVTQAKTIEEAFRMAYDAKDLLEEYRAELAEEAKARQRSVRG